MATLLIFTHTVTSLKLRLGLPQRLTKTKQQPGQNPNRRCCVVRCDWWCCLLVWIGRLCTCVTRTCRTNIMHRDSMTGRTSCEIHPTASGFNTALKPSTIRQY